MVGHTGGIVKENDQGFEINPALDFINKSDRVLINRVCNLGFLYRKIKSFCDDLRESMVEDLFQNILDETFPDENNS